jgi:hypothetical protein
VSPEEAASIGQAAGRISGLIAVFVVIVLIYSVIEVRKQRAEIRSQQRVDPPWGDSASFHGQPQDVSELDEWDRSYLAGEIDEEQWNARGDPPFAGGLDS